MQFDNDKEQSARQTYASTNRLISLRPWNLPPVIPMATARMWAELQLTSDNTNAMPSFLIMVAISPRPRIMRHLFALRRIILEKLGHCLLQVFVILVGVLLKVDGLVRISAPDQLLFAGVIQVHEQHSNGNRRGLARHCAVSNPPHPPGPPRVPKADKLTPFSWLINAR